MQPMLTCDWNGKVLKSNNCNKKAREVVKKNNQEAQKGNWMEVLQSFLCQGSQTSLPTLQEAFWAKPDAEHEMHVLTMQWKILSLCSSLRCHRRSLLLCFYPEMMLPRDAVECGFLPREHQHLCVLLAEQGQRGVTPGKPQDFQLLTHVDS